MMIRSAPPAQTQDFAESRLSRMRLGRRAVVIAVSAVCLVAALWFVDDAAVAAALSDIDAGYAALTVALILCNNALAMLRLQSILTGLNLGPAWRHTVLAFVAGQLANQFILNVIGQGFSRAAVLRYAGIPLGATVIVTLGERLLAFFILLVASVPAAVIIIPRLGFSLRDGGAYFLSLAIGALVVLVAVLAIVPQAATCRRALGHLRDLVARFWPAGLLTVLAHLCMLGAYLSALCSVGVTTLTVEVGAAFLIVMFAASLPFSLAGWGVREFTAVAALGVVGVATPTAMSAAVIVGALSLAVTLVAAAVVPLLPRPVAGPRAMMTSIGVRQWDWNELLAFGCGVLAAMAIFFQVRVSQGDELITANAADPFALLALGLGAYFLLARRGRLPVTGGFAVAVALVSSVVLYGLIVGYLTFGSNNWAAVNRGFGWVVLMGYMSCTITVVAVCGEAGRNLILRVLIIAGTTIAAYQLLALAVMRLGLQIPYEAVAFPLTGFAANSNAFAFQMVVTGVAAMAASQLGLIGRRGLVVAVLVVLGVAIYFSQSRAGLVMYLMALILAVPFAGSGSRLNAMRTTVATVIAGAVVVLVYASLPWLTSISDEGGQAGSSWQDAAAYASLRLTAESSDLEHWMTLEQGWDLWLQSPVFGNGIGAYVENRVNAGQTFFLIHSVPVWLLAETGLIGLIAVVAGVLFLLRGAQAMLTEETQRAWGRAAITLLLCAAAGNLVHDLLYQRIFWFVLPLCFALPAIWRDPPVLEERS